jgi:hypothetical protein
MEDHRGIGCVNTTLAIHCADPGALGHTWGLSPMPPPEPLATARVRAIIAHMRAEERELAEELRLSDEFRHHCETKGLGRTSGTLFACALWHSLGRIWVLGGSPEELEKQRRAFGEAEARDPWLQLRAALERAMAAADEADEAAEMRGADTEAEPSEVGSVPQQTEHRGRPPQYDWLEFAKEVVRIANTPDGLPDRETMQRHMMAWCKKTWRKAPHPATVRSVLKKLWP